MSSADAEVEVTLKGGPEGLPETVVVGPAQLRDQRLKIPFRAGYEHFVPERPAGDSKTRDSKTRDSAVFVWCDRTEFAE